ncbi:efflux RND transporter periplasmic adaptor subunit [Aerosakkonemataceae cyanobacterium BLCC-F50]|uniref:Efflux RND transporter periplasmic adaptor subunit n=1 Tax=Floridaenema flaviceps BLCC-F50 TaxID=3153642 RepID=A0ABV4Y122_9CYAN
MSQINTFFSRTISTTIVSLPLVVMGVLATKFLLPELKNPESNFYQSSMGYPAVQRKAGQPIKVQTVAVQTKSLADNLAAPGESVALQKVDVRSQISGAVEKVYVTEGQWIRKGQPLIELQKAVFEAEVDKAKNDLTTAEQNLQTLESSAPAKLLELKQNVKLAQARLIAAKTKQQQIDGLAEEELKNNVAAAIVRLKTAEQKLKQIKLLAQQGAIPKFQLYDMEDTYATRKKELLMAQQGSLETQNKRFINQDFSFTRQNELIAAEQELELTQKRLQKELADARLTLENKKIELQEAQRNLNKTVIYATTNGLVSQVNINAGEIADSRSSESLVTLTQEVVFKAYIDQARLNAVKVGDSATVRLIAYPGRTFSGRVVQLNPTVQTDAVRPSKVGIDRQFTYSVWVAVEDLQMPPGLQGFVQFEQGKTALVIPESAVTHLSGSEGMVMVASSGIAIVKKVRLGNLFDNQREVLEGLELGEQVIPSARALYPGDRIDIDTAQSEDSKNNISSNELFFIPGN